MTATATAPPTAAAEHRPAPTRRSLPAPPRALVVAAGVALAIGVVMAVAGAWRTGVSWDETYHVLRMRNYLEHGWFLLDADLDHGSPGSWVEQTHVYAPVTMLLLHGWSILLGTDSPGVVSTSAHAYAVRHLGVVLISLVGVAATATLTRLLLRSWGWALVCAAVLVAVPTWTGHAMFNVKDVPVATGYTLVTLGVCVVCRTTRRPWVAAGLLTTLAGLVLAVGTRPGIWPGLALAGGIGVLLLARHRQWGRALALVVVAVLGVAVVTALYPEGFAHPVATLVDGAFESSRYGDKQGSWWYLPLYLGIELPTLLLVLGATGTVLLVLRLVRRSATGTDPLVGGLVLLQTFLLPGLAVAREANLYTGLRQLLFAAPGLAVLVTVALAVLWARPRRAAGVVRRVVPLLTGLAVGVPLLVQAQLFPYSYAFSSVPAGVISPILAADNRDLEVQTDYWRTSVRELAPSIPTAGYVTCTPRIDDQDRFLPRADESREDCGTDVVGPLAPYDATRAGGPAPSPEHFLAVDAGSAFVGSNCTALHRVTRHLWWRTVTMSSVSDCDLVLADYPAGGAAFDGAGRGADYLRGGWSLLRQDPGAGLGVEPGFVSFTLPADLAAGAVRVAGTGIDVGGLAASANGVAVPVRTDGEGFVLDVPAATVSSYGGGRLVLELTDTAPDVLRLLTLQITALDPGGPR